MWCLLVWQCNHCKDIFTGIKDCKYSENRWQRWSLSYPGCVHVTWIFQMSRDKLVSSLRCFLDHTFNSQQCRVHRFFFRIVGIPCCNKHKSSAYSDFVPCLVTIWAHSKFDVLLGIKYFSQAKFILDWFYTRLFFQEWFLDVYLQFYLILVGAAVVKFNMGRRGFLWCCRTVLQKHRHINV